MRIDLDDAKGAPVPWAETVEFDLESLETPEIVALGPIESAGELSFAEPNFRLRGTLSYQQTLNCYRCLEPMKNLVDDRFEYVLERRPPRTTSDEHGDASAGDHSANHSESEIELAEADLEVFIVESDHIDPKYYVREQVLLHVPMKPLCRHDCKGLCGQCGADLNAAHCTCESVTADPRWAGLESIKVQLES